MHFGPNDFGALDLLASASAMPAAATPLSLLPLLTIKQALAAAEVVWDLNGARELGVVAGGSGTFPLPSFRSLPTSTHAYPAPPCLLDSFPFPPPCLVPPPAPPLFPKYTLAFAPPKQLVAKVSPEARRRGAARTTGSLSLSSAETNPIN